MLKGIYLPRKVFKEIEDHIHNTNSNLVTD